MTFPAPRSSVRRWAGASTVALVATLAMAGCAGDGTRPVSDEIGEPSGTGKPRPTKESTPTAEPTDSPSEPTGTTVPIYWVGDGPGGEPRLFREFQRVTGDPLTEAARLVTSGEARDPDYRTLFPGGGFGSVRVAQGRILVDARDDGWRTAAAGMSRREARLAVQQLVYTLQGVQQQRLPVQVVLGGRPDLLFGIDTTEPVTAASALATLNLVNITSPEEGATVTGDTLKVTGVASSFEASGPCRLLSGDEEVAAVGYQADGWMEDRLFPFEAEIPLDGISGEVVLQCETDDPSGGAEGNGPAVDTKTITVQ